MMSPLGLTTLSYMCVVSKPQNTEKGSHFKIIDSNYCTLTCKGDSGPHFTLIKCQTHALSHDNYLIENKRVDN